MSSAPHPHNCFKSSHSYKTCDHGTELFKALISIHGKTHDFIEISPRTDQSEQDDIDEMT